MIYLWIERFDSSESKLGNVPKDNYVRLCLRSVQRWRGIALKTLEIHSPVRLYWSVIILGASMEHYSIIFRVFY